MATAFLAVGAGPAIMAAPGALLLLRAVDKAGLRGMYGFSSAILTVVFATGYALGPLFGAASWLAAPFWMITPIVAAVVAVAVVGVGRMAIEAGEGPERRRVRR